MASIYGISLKKVIRDCNSEPKSASVYKGNRRLGKWTRKDNISKFDFDEKVLEPMAKKFAEYRKTARPYRFRPSEPALSPIDRLLLTLAELEEDHFMFVKFRDEAGYPILAIYEAPNPINSHRTTANNYMGMQKYGEPPLDGTLEGYAREVRENWTDENNLPYKPVVIYLDEDDFTIR